MKRLALTMAAAALILVGCASATAKPDVLATSQAQVNEAKPAPSPVPATNTPVTATADMVRIAATNEAKYAKIVTTPAPATNTPVPTATPVQAPAPPPTVAAEPRRPIIPGLKVADIRAAQSKIDINCNVPGVASSTLVLQCRASRGLNQYDLAVRGYSPTEIYMVSLMVNLNPPSDSEAAQMLGYVAAGPYDGANFDRAMSFAKTKIDSVSADSPASIIIGGAKMKMGGPATARWIELTGAE